MQPLASWPSPVLLTMHEAVHGGVSTTQVDVAARRDPAVDTSVLGQT